MRALIKIIDIILILVVLTALYFCDNQFNEFFYNHASFHALIPMEILRVSCITLLCFVMFLLFFKGVVRVEIPLKGWQKIVITVILLLLPHLTTIWMFAPIRAYVGFSVVAIIACRTYGTMLAGAWLALLCLDRFTHICIGDTSEKLNDSPSND